MIPIFVANFTKLHNITGDKLLLNFGAKFQWNYQVAMPTFGVKFLDKINKSKPKDCKHNLSSMILRYQCTPNDHHSLAPLYSRTFDANPNKVYIFWELNNCRLRRYMHRHKKMYGFPNIARYFPKYRGSLIKFVSGQIWSGEHNQHRYVFLTPFSKKWCQEILITCLVCFWHAVKHWELIKHAFSSLKRS